MAHTTRRSFGRAVAGALLGALTPGCDPWRRPSIDRASFDLTVEHDTAEALRGIVAGRVGAIFYVRRMRGRPGADRILGFSHWGQLAAQMNIDPMNDIERTFACGTSSSASDGALVFEHVLTDAEALAAITTAGGGKLSPSVSLPFPSTQITLGESMMELALPRSTLVAVVPIYQASRLGELARSGGLPNPRGSEVARFFAFQPRETLGSSPEWPPTISAAQAEISFDERGGAVVLFQATSTSKEQAILDAAQMDKTLDDLLHIDLEIIRIPIFDPIHFRADDRVVRMEAHLLASDVDWLLAFGR